MMTNKEAHYANTICKYKVPMSCNFPIIKQSAKAILMLLLACIG